MSACPNAAAQIIWRELYQRARQAQRPRVLSPFAEAGGVGAALLAADGSIYTGVCIDMACGLGHLRRAGRRRADDYLRAEPGAEAGRADAGRAAGCALRRLL